jgi:hypothetical protein
VSILPHIALAIVVFRSADMADAAYIGSTPSDLRVKNPNAIALQ